MKKNGSRKERVEQAARALLRLTQEHMKSYSLEEQDRKWQAFESKVAEINERRKSANRDAMCRGMLSLVLRMHL